MIAQNNACVWGSSNTFVSQEQIYYYFYFFKFGNHSTLVFPRVE